MPAARVVCLLLLPALGCQGRIRHSAKLYWPHKDVAIVSISLDHRLSPDEYLAVAEERLAALRGSDFVATEIPVYEVRFEYFLTRAGALAERVARVVFVADTGPGFDEPPEITIY